MVQKEGSWAKKDKKKEEEEEGEVVARMNVDSNDDLCLPAASPSLNGQGLY